jgi:hypothetical protein
MFGNTMITIVLACFMAATVFGLPLKDANSDADLTLLQGKSVPIGDAIDYHQDAFGDELSYNELDDELSFLQDLEEDKGDEFYKNNLPIEHELPAHDDLDTYPTLLLQGLEAPLPKDHYIVGLKNSVSKKCREELEFYLKANTGCSSGIVVGRDLGLVDGFSFVATRSTLDKCLLKNNDVLGCDDVHGDLEVRKVVRYVEVNAREKLEANAAAAPIWSLDRIDARKGQDGMSLDTAGLNGAGVDVYVVDTGIRTTHVDFEGRARAGRNFCQDKAASDTSDCNGHGTHCAGTVGGKVYGVAKKANLIAMRSLDCNGSGRSSGTIDAYNWVKNNRNSARPSIISASLGGPVSQASKDAVAAITSAGITIVVAAGNENQDACLGSPANQGGSGPAITVGATDTGDRRASFSCYGSCVDIFAPGTAIKSADEDSDTGEDTMQGTSMATPAVAGAAALILSANPDLSPAQVKSTLLCKATSGEITDTRGSPNKLLYVGSGASCGISDVPAPPRPTNAPNYVPSTRDCLSTASPCTITASGCPITKMSITLQCHSPNVRQSFDINDNSRLSINGCSSCSVIDGPGWDQEAAPSPVVTPTPVTPVTPAPVSSGGGSSCLKVVSGSTCVIEASGCPVSQFTFRLKCYSPSVEQDFQINDNSRMTINGCSSCGIADHGLGGGSSPNPAPAPAPAPACPSHCEGWKNDGMCDDDCWTSTCKADVNDCTSTPTTPSPTRSPTPAPVAPAPAPAPSGCSNMFSDTSCARYAARDGGCPSWAVKYCECTC